MEKILLIDDDLDFLSINRLILEKNGYTVEDADSPEKAWQKIIDWKPDLICLDIMTPTRTEGFHLAYKIREHKDAASIPILMISSIHDKSDFAFSPETDGDFLPVEDFLEKPVRAEVLIEKVKYLLSKKHSPDAHKSDDKGIGLKKKHSS